MKNLFALSFICLFLVGCVGTSKQTNFYQLTSSFDEKVALKNSKKYLIAIEPVVVAPYLARPQLVSTGSDDNVLNISDLNRWAEPLSSSTQRIISENISKYLQKSVVKPLAGSRKDYDYRIYVEIAKFDGKLGDKIEFSGWWSIVDKNGKILSNNKISYEQKIGNSYEEMVKSQSEMLGSLSLEIAKNIR